jgi:putative transcriptional regulator
MIRLQRLSVLVAAMSLSATLLGAALPTAAGAPERASLAGQLLIASPTMGDPRFHHAVILMVRHDQNGALGIVVNRPVGERPLAALLAALGDKDTGLQGTVRIFSGGPVQPEIALVIHSADYQRSGTIDIDGRVAMTSSLEILRDIGSNRGPSKSLVAFGYAGWGPGQLEGEIGHGFWFNTPQDAKLVFDQERDQVWDDAMKRRTQDL